MVKSFEEISKMLKESLLINAARAKTLTLIIFAMINCETVNLSKLSKHFKTHVKQASSYKRLQKFIKGVSFELTLCTKKLKSAPSVYKVLYKVCIEVTQRSAKCAKWLIM